MAPRYRPSPIDIWRNARFVSLPDDAKLLHQYTTTGPQTNRIGLFVFSPALAAEDLNWPMERLSERFAKLVETLGWGWDPGTRVLFLPEWWNVARPANPNVFKSCLDDLQSLPASPLIASFCANKSHLPANFSKLLPNVSANVCGNVPPNYPPQEQEQEQEPPPPTPSVNASPKRAAWGEVGELLLSLGMSRVDDAVATAQVRGLAPADVRTLIDEWRANDGAWGVGALYQRLSGELAAWPPVAPTFYRKQSQRKSIDHQAAVVTKRLDDERRRDQDDEWFVRLNAKHSDAIEAMSPEAVIEALDTPQLLSAYRSRGVTRLVRERLFDVLELAEQQPVPA